MNRYNYYNSDLDAFTSYHLEAEPNDAKLSGSQPSAEANALMAGVSGAIGTSISNVMVYPIDLIVKRLQVQRQLRNSRQAQGKSVNTDEKEDKLYTDFVDAARRIYDEEGGIAAFYSGCLHDTINSMGNAFLYFLAYNFVREYRLRTTSKPARTLGATEEITIGVVAGAFSRFITAPVSNIVTRKQVAALEQKDVSTKQDTPSVRNIVNDIYTEKGVTGFWSGYNATLYLTLNPAITFFLYESLKSLLPRRFRDSPTAGQAFMIGAVAKAAANTLMYPFSLAKSRGQVQKNSSGNNAGVIQMLRDVYEREGVRGWYEGVQGEVAKGFFQNGITMLIKEFIHQNILSVYFFLSRLRNRPSDQSLTSTVYQSATSETPQETADRLATASQNALESAKSTLTTAKENVNAAVSSAKDNLSSAADSARERISTAVESAGQAKDTVVENVQKGYEQVQGKVSEVMSKSGEVIGKGTESIKETTIDARRNLASAIDVEKEPVGDVSREIGGIEWSDDK